MLALRAGCPAESSGLAGGSRVTRASCGGVGSTSWVAARREDRGRPPPGAAAPLTGLPAYATDGFARKTRLASETDLEGEVGGIR